MASPGSPIGSPLGCIDVGLKGGLLTGGLGRPACMGIITMLPFQLGCFLFEPPPPPPEPRPEGGAIPLEPGEIHDFYQPVDYDFINGDFAKPETYGKKMAKLTFRSELFNVEKEYMLSERKAKAVVRVMKIANVTRKGMRVTANNIKRFVDGVSVKVKNLRKKYWS